MELWLEFVCVTRPSLVEKSSAPAVPKRGLHTPFAAGWIIPRGRHCCAGRVSLSIFEGPWPLTALSWMDAGAQRVFVALMRGKKIDRAALQAAYDTAQLRGCTESHSVRHGWPCQSGSLLPVQSCLAWVTCKAVLENLAGRCSDSVLAHRLVRRTRTQQFTSLCGVRSILPNQQKAAPTVMAGAALLVQWERSGVKP